MGKKRKALVMPSLSAPPVHKTGQLTDKRKEREWSLRAGATCVSVLFLKDITTPRALVAVKCAVKTTLTTCLRRIERPLTLLARYGRKRRIRTSAR